MIKFPATRRQHELIMINTSCKRKSFLDLHGRSLPKPKIEVDIQ